jgi:DNA polymerase-3 subunit delta'
MNNAATRGQPRALAEVATMVLGQAPHAVLFVGPGSVGKTTLALDLAAGLLCKDPDPGARPCRNCRGCRQVASGNHPDLHRLAPDGPGRQVKIGDSSRPDPGTVRHLLSELSLLPAEGGARVAIIEQAHRLNEDAQSALLKMLEEPPPGVTIVLCADDEECLLLTVRSRCIRVRMGPAGGREIERWLGELGVADAPRAARLARLAEGRPGLALAYARSMDAERLRGEIARGLLDMLAATRQTRLATVRELTRSAVALDAALDQARGNGSVEDDGPAPTAKRGRKGKVAKAAEPEGDAAEGDAAAPKLAAADRRSAATTLIGIWASVGRDLAIARAGGAKKIRELELIDELPAVAPAVSAATLSTFQVQLATIATQLDDNVNAELALDVLALAWPYVLPQAMPGALAGRAR